MEKNIIVEVILLKGLKVIFFLFVKFEFLIYREKRNNLLRISELKKGESGVNYGKRVASFAKNKGSIYFSVGFFV